VSEEEFEMQASPRVATTSGTAARARIILALDVPSLEAARALVAPLRDGIGAVKIGKELFTACGPEAVRAMSEYGLPVFLDLKYHDIPNTVAGAVRAAGRLGVRWMTVHTAGGADMMRAAAGAALGEPRPLLLGVTVLTSQELSDPEEVVERALLAQRCGLDGVIASPQEVARLRAACGPDFLIVTPGVRPAGAALQDQRRVATPGEAIREGADALVIGRPIAAAADPVAAAAAIAADIAAGLDQRTGAPPTRATIASRLEAMLGDSQALLRGHFLLSSGLHSDRYVQCARLLAHPDYARHAGRWLADRLRARQPDVVLGVALGGLVIGQETAAALGLPALFVERDAVGAMALRRGFTLDPGARVVVVDDVCTRGGSFAEAMAVVRAHGALVVAAGAIIDRSGGQHRLEVPLDALLEVRADAYAAGDCPQCAAGIPVVKPGSRPTPKA
jgi:orotidine-5'-phosphate decarboxylase